jgi:hypothetical protein
MKNPHRPPVPLHFTTSDPDLDRILKPATRYAAPEDVLEDPGLSLPEKKAILASWASDACAVDSQPALRQPPSAPAPISFDAIMRALQEVDRLQESAADARGGGARAARDSGARVARARHVC